jgi:hypothetical protein
MPVIYTSEYFGGTAIPSVSTFGDLPASGVTDQRISITGESSLFDTTSYPAIVAWSGSAWQLESCAATYLNIAAVEFASGTWTGTGGTVGTRSGARIVDTTYNEPWIWNSGNSLFVPSYLGGISIADAKSIKGDSATPSGWTPTVTAVNGSLTTDGSRLTFYARGTTGTTNVSTLSYSDAGRTTSSNFYMKCLAQRSTSANWNTETSPGPITFHLEYISGPTTGRIVEFGDADINGSSTTLAEGKFFNRTSTTIELYSATANRGANLTVETLLQFHIIAGTVAQVKVGNGAWHDIAVSTCRFVSGGTTFAFGVSARNHTNNKAEGKLRYLQAIRYT